MEALFLAGVALACVLLYLLVAGRSQLLMLRLGGLLWLAAALFIVAASMQFCRHLLAVIHTERFRFWPLVHSVELGAEVLPLRRALQIQTIDDAFSKVRESILLVSSASGFSFCSCAQHLAYEDMCFVAEKDATRRSAVFDDQSGGSWADLSKAALAPVDEIVAAIKAAEQTKSSGPVSSTLQANEQLAVWGIRAMAAMASASRSQDKFGVAQRSKPTVGDVLSRLLSLHLGTFLCVSFACMPSSDINVVSPATSSVACL